MSPYNLQINEARFRSNFESLAQIGKNAIGGIHRPTFSPAHLQARKWFQERAGAASLDFGIDNAGNHSAILQCGPLNGPTLLLGSHLDSVPNGGIFDGALGILAAFEVLQTIQDLGSNLPFHIEVIDFTDEEGTLVGLLGSRAIAGKLTKKDLIEPRGGRQILLKHLKHIGLTEDGLFKSKRDPQSLAGYLELHIEQGARLHERNIDIGIVNSIVGICSYEIIFLGSANHAGTTSMKSRLDAAQGVSAYTLAVREFVIQDFPNCVANIGNLCLEPGVFNIIPQRAVASLEFRAPSVKFLNLLETALLDLAHEQADRFGLGLEINFCGKHSPALMNSKIQTIFGTAAQSLCLSTIPLSSGAGHDAQSMANICPTGMIFVPSIDGISHSHQEFTIWQDCVNGANMLLLAVLELASQHGPL